MTQLLISVKNVEEALIAKHTGVDIVDLKDPDVGALGALDVGVVRQIVTEMESTLLISATVGEHHDSVEALLRDVQLYASLGVDVVKVAVSDLFQQKNFLTEVLQLTSKGIKIVAVFFADKNPNLNLISKLEKSGFYGAMMDTSKKSFSLLTVQSERQLKGFLDLSKQYQLVSGLAGSLGREEVTTLLRLQPEFIGMRGGVCQNQDRKSALSDSKLRQIKGMLLNYNISYSK